MSFWNYHYHLCKTRNFSPKKLKSFITVQITHIQQHRHCWTTTQLFGLAIVYQNVSWKLRKGRKHALKLERIFVFVILLRLNLDHIYILTNGYFDRAFAASLFCVMSLYRKHVCVWSYMCVYNFVSTLKYWKCAT